MNTFIVNNKIIFSGDICFFIRWITKGGKHIPIYGPGEIRGKTFRDFNQAQSWGEKHYDDFADTLSREEEQSLMNYKGKRYEKINGYLRHGEESLPQNIPDAMLNSIKQDVSNIDKVLKKTNLVEDIVVYKGGSFLDVKKGNVIIDKGFTSTTLDRTQGKYYSDIRGGNTLNRISIPKGSKALFLDSVHNTGEVEMLLPRNGRFLVRNVRTGAKGATVVSLDYLGEG